ncbi:MAG: T9SS type A sorting domain-containing protein [Bacteroidales bacterium]|nr:T9SS type A sorting domain-containing protein [Bacteroidales bacterium]
MYQLEGSFAGLKMDSVKLVGEDSIFYPKKMLIYRGYDCLKGDGSFLGKQVIVKSNGTNCFLNSDNDTLAIKTNALLGESWEVYRKGLTLITAEIKAIQKETFLGLSDSVKTITFHVFDASMKPIANPLEGKQIKISKQYGIIQALDFYDVPLTQFFVGEVVSLLGMTYPKVGVQNLLWKEIWDIHPGDELNILTADHSEYPGIPKSYFYRKEIKKYLNRVDRNDSIIFTIDYLRSDSSLNNQVLSYNVRPRDTITEIIPPNPFFDKLPQELFSESENSVAFNRMDEANIKTFHYMDFYLSQSCYTMPISDGCFPEYTYYKQRGGSYYGCGDIFSGGGTRLAYSKIGGVESGTKLVITGIVTPSSESAFKVYLGVNQKQLMVNAVSESLPCQVDLMNVSGVIVMNATLTNETNTLSLKHLAAGVYIYRMKGENSQQVSGKIVLKR